MTRRMITPSVINLPPPVTIGSEVCNIISNVINLYFKDSGLLNRVEFVRESQKENVIVLIFETAVTFLQYRALNLIFHCSLPIDKRFSCHIHMTTQETIPF
jgi:hypothetical protein